MSLKSQVTKHVKGVVLKISLKQTPHYPDEKKKLIDAENRQHRRRKLTYTAYSCNTTNGGCGVEPTSYIQGFQK